MGQVSPYLRRATNGYAHWCPGCGEMHSIAVDKPLHNGARWSFNGDVNKPTFSPSIHIKTGRYADPDFDDSEEPDLSKICHYFLQDGELRYCGDSTHALAGKNVPLPELPPWLQDDPEGA